MAYLNNEQLALAFSTHKFDPVFERLAQGVTWDLIGGRTHTGKDAVVAVCRESADYLSDISTTFDSVRTIATDTSVVVDSRASYTEDDGSISRVASCDIYDFEGELLTAITSYTVEL
jgi:limonene-1,2-epoxide hydrolase